MLNKEDGTKMVYTVKEDQDKNGTVTFDGTSYSVSYREKGKDWTIENKKMTIHSTSTSPSYTSPTSTGSSKGRLSKTGDGLNPTMYIQLLGIAGLAMFVGGVWSRREFRYGKKKK